ncbi:MAG TPA: DNA polymerase I, partial [Candidatus Latescibacteria bacterium]|nr:DNA polymerase I [Candidatus Latescibacterota bacterium]
MKRLFLIDGSALTYRSYFAFARNPLINSKGEDTSAPYGFVNSLLKLFRDYNPEYIVVVFDTGKPTFRHERFPEYKATRQKMPEDMATSLPRIYQILEAMNIPVLEVEGYEADDVIGTLAKRAVEEGFEAVIVAGDKDFFQLVGPGVKVLRPTRTGKEEGMEWVDEKGVEEHIGVPPERVRDLLALTGDTSDNIPGVPGVGEKTARALVRSYGDLEAVLARSDAVARDKVRENLKQFADQARLSKELVTIRTDVPIEDVLEKPLSLEDFHFQGFNRPALQELFKELEFRRFLREITVEEAIQEVHTRLAEAEDLEEIARRAKAQGFVSVDIETTSTEPMSAEIVGVSLSLSPGEAFYIPVGHILGPNVPWAKVRDVLGSVLEDEKVEKYGQNVKYDMIVLSRQGVEPKGFTFDTMIASYLLNPSGRQHNLEVLSLTYLGRKMVPISDLIGSGKKQRSFSEVPVEQAAKYSGEDAEVVLRLKEFLERELESRALAPLFREVEMPLVEVLKDMEMHGMKVDGEYLRTMSLQVEAELKKLEEEIYRMAGERFNINSTQQLGHILFEKLKLPVIRRTKTGYSTDVGVLEALAGEHELPRRVLEYRQLAKLKSTYIDALPKLIHPETGRIHTSFNQTVTATGRLSSSDPNLQNIPIRTELGRRIRQAFVAPDEDHLLLDVDYSQIELRILAHLSEDRNLMAVFREGGDIHTRTACAMFGVPPQFVTLELRRRAKTINFGIIYGMSPFGLAEQLGISRHEARALIDQYFRQYPGVKAYVDRTLEDARRRGYVTTLLGRRRYLPEVHSPNRQIREFAERTAINTPVQGTAADLIKMAMVRVWRRLKEGGYEAKMILQVHDELVFEVDRK